LSLFLFLFLYDRGSAGKYFPDPLPIKYSKYIESFSTESNAESHSIITLTNQNVTVDSSI
ncbi:MAG: hypothetical protein ACJ71R_12445, partial [Nitrososphaeraceae archaeon]